MLGKIWNWCKKHSKKIAVGAGALPVIPQIIDRCMKIAEKDKPVRDRTLKYVGIAVLVAGGGYCLYKYGKWLDKEQDHKHKRDEIDAKAKAKAKADSDVIKTRNESKAEEDIKVIKARNEANILQYREKTEIDIEKYKRMKAINTNSEAKALKSAVSYSSSDANSNIDLSGHSYSELFHCSTIDCSYWIVDGYMKVGLVNLIVAGSNVGKSNLMVQIALAVAKGIRPEFLPDTCKASMKLKVFYYRIEDFSSELKGKYGDGTVLCNSGIIWYLTKDLPEFTMAGFFIHLKKLAEQLTEDALVCIDPATKFADFDFAKFIRGVEGAMHIAKAREVTMTIAGVAHLDEIKDWTLLTNCDIKGGDKGIQQAGSVTAIRRERTDVETYRFLQCLKEPKGHPKPFKGEVLVCKAKDEDIDGNKYLHYQYDCVKPVTEALPLKPKAAPNSVEISTVQPTSPQFDNTTNNLPEWKGKLPLEQAMQMKEDYKLGLAGSGLKQMAKKHGLKYEMDVKRELEKLDKYLQEQKGEIEQ